MAWSFVGVGTSVEVTATTHTLTVPAGVAAGDLLVACIASRIASTTSITLPTGGEWTLVSEQKTNNVLTTGSAVASGMMAYCVRGASDPNLTFTHPAAPAPALGRIVAYRGGATPTASAKDTQTSATTAISITAVNLTGLTTTQSDDLIVAMLAGGQEAAWSVFKSANAPSTASGATDTTTAPSTTTWIERADVQTTTSNDTSLGIFDAVKSAAGATGNFTATASVAASHALVAGAFKILPPSTADAWNVNDKSASITLSASDKTATSTSSGQGVRSTTTHNNGTAGKYYAEFVMGATIPSRVGVTPMTNTVTATTANMHVFLSAGSFIVNGSSVGTPLGAFAASDVLCVAWDTGAEQIWFRKNGGNWNSDASANPATATNGLDCSFAASTAHALWETNASSGQSITIRTEAAEFTQAGPSGFTSWMGETLTSPSVTADVTGQELTTAVGTVTVTTVAGVTADATGQSVTASVGTATVSLPTRVDVTGQEIAAAVGTATVSGKATASVTGQAVTASVGTVTATGKATATVTGQEVAASVGTVTVSLAAGVSASVTGQEIAVSVGSVSVTAIQKVSANVTGQELTTAVGTATVTGKATATLTGQEIASAAGSVAVTAVQKATADVTGQQISALVNGVSVTAGGSVSVSLTGQQLTASVGTATATAIAGTVGVWNGTSWVQKPAKVWTGSAWVQKPVKTWNGTSWAA